MLLCLYTHVSIAFSSIPSVSDVRCKCSSRCFKSKLGCCTARPVAAEQRSAAAACRCCWCVAVGQPTWVSPCRHRVGTEARVLRWTRDANRQDVERRAWGPRPDSTSHLDVRAIGLPSVDLFYCKIRHESYLYT
jgi:hypothetical protein